MHLTNEPPNQARNKSITKANKLSIMRKFKSGHKHTKKRELCQNPDNLSQSEPITQIKYLIYFSFGQYFIILHLTQTMYIQHHL